MSTVREATFELFRAHGMTTMFGNPGSTELPMLTDFPDDFTYILGLQELAVVGMADGYAQATGRPTHVNLHTAPGVGNAVGGIFNAQANKAPLVITAGQQVRAHVTMEANLTNRDATWRPQPYVKWSHEPARAQDVPAAIARAIHHASLPPTRPVVRLDPDGRLGRGGRRGPLAEAARRSISPRTGPDPGRAGRTRRAPGARRSNPVLVAGPDIDASGGWDSAVALAERQRLAVWATPATGGGRIGFPENHPQFVGVLPPAIGAVSEMLKEHDLVLVVGSSVFPYYPYIPGPLLAEENVARADLERSRRGGPRADGRRDPRRRRPGPEGLVELVGESDRQAPDPRPQPDQPASADPMSGSEAMAALADAWPADGIAVLEAPSSTMAFRNRLRLSRPGSYYFGASGGLGFGIAAAVGVQLAQPARPVVCVLGEGSAQYGITALWTAVAYKVPVTFLVLRNEEYMILKWFAAFEQVANAPGLELPGLDVAAVARGYGVPAREVAGREELTQALREEIPVQDGPRLVQVRVASGMWME